jgi:hypothetical protein
MRHEPRRSESVKRFAPHILSAFAVFSAILCASTIGLWLRSYHVADACYFDRPNSRTSIGSARGQLFLDRTSLEPESAGPHFVHFEFSRTPGYHRVPLTPSGPATNLLPPSWRWAGFAFASSSNYRFTAWDARVPFWFVTLLSAIAPAAWAWRYHRRRRAAVRGFDVQVMPGKSTR